MKDGKPIFTETNAEIYGEWLGQTLPRCGVGMDFAAVTAVWITDEQRKSFVPWRAGFARAMAGLT